MTNLAAAYDEWDYEKYYWTDGKNIFHTHYKIIRADLDTFEHYYGAWARDKYTCYSGSKKLKDANVNTFKALNLTFAKDESYIWTLGGKIESSDTINFVTCDDGRLSLDKSFVKIDNKLVLRERFVPYGFGKDKNKVYYYNYQGKTKVVNKAHAKTFISLNDGYFAYDEKFVFCGNKIVPKANPKTWSKLKENYYYSQDKNKIYYFNKLIKDVDAATFKIVVTPSIIDLPLQLAQDKNSGFLNGRRISLSELNKNIELEKELYNSML